MNNKAIHKPMPDLGELWKEMLEYAPDAIYLLDTNGIFLYGNKAAEEMIGRKREDFIGKSFMKAGLLDKGQLTKAAMNFMKNLGGRSIGPEEYTLITKDQEKKHVEISAYLATIGGKKMMIGIARDISKCRDAENKLRDSEEKFSKVFKSNLVLMAISTVDDGLIIDVNDMFLKTLGFKREEVIGAMSADLDIWVDYKERDKVIQRVKKDGYAKNVEVDVKDKDGNVHNGLFSIQPILIKGQRCLLTMMTDITDFKRK